MTTLNTRVQYFNGKRSQAMQGELILLESERLRLIVDGDSLEFAADEISVGDRLGNTPRALYFPDGGMAEAADNDAIDAMFSRQLAKRGWLHRLESKWHYVAASLLLLIALMWFLIQYAVPAFATIVAFNIPIETEMSLGDTSLASLDKVLFEPSTLPESTRRRLTSGFARISSAYDAEYDFRLHYRASPVIGANALALPGGHIIMTDELVALAENDAEVLAVLAHEMGHVVERHVLRQALRSSISGLIMLVVTGDLSAGGGVLAALPVVITEAKFSRDFEREADLFAHKFMTENQIALESFPNILKRLSAAQGADEDTDADNGFFSSHPGTAERARLFHGH